MKWLLVEVCDLAFDRSSLMISKNPHRKVGGRLDLTIADEVCGVAGEDLIVTPFGAARKEI